VQASPVVRKHCEKLSDDPTGFHPGKADHPFCVFSGRAPRGWPNRTQIIGTRCEPGQAPGRRARRAVGGGPKKNRPTRAGEVGKFWPPRDSTLECTLASGKPAPRPPAPSSKTANKDDQARPSWQSLRGARCFSSGRLKYRPEERRGNRFHTFHGHEFGGANLLSKRQKKNKKTRCRESH